MPSGKKAKKFVLGVADSKLGGAIQDAMGLKCEAGGMVAEVIRGVRLYFTKLVKGVCVSSTHVVVSGGSVWGGMP